MHTRPDTVTLPEKTGKVKGIWQSIKRVAAPVATILQTAAAVKELIG